MASDQQFVDYVRDQISGAGHITWRKMFGEFALYCNGKVVALVCDNQFYVKPTKAGRAYAAGIAEAPPYPGAKPYLLVDEQLDDRPWITALIAATERELPLPKPKPAPGAAKTVVKAAKASTRKAAAKKTSLPERVNAKPVTAPTVPAKSATAKSATPKSATAKSATAKSATAKSATAKSATAKSAVAKSATAKSASAKAGESTPAPRKAPPAKCLPSAGKKPAVKR